MYVFAMWQDELQYWWQNILSYSYTFPFHFAYSKSGVWTFCPTWDFISTVNAFINFRNLFFFPHSSNLHHELALFLCFPFELLLYWVMTKKCRQEQLLLEFEIMLPQEACLQAASVSTTTCEEHIVANWIFYGNITNINWVPIIMFIINSFSSSIKVYSQVLMWGGWLGGCLMYRWTQIYRDKRNGGIDGLNRGSIEWM